MGVTRELGRPCVVTDGGEGVVPALVGALGGSGGGVTLNVAGPRASEWAKGYEVTWWVLDALRAGGLVADQGRGAPTRGTR